MSQIALPHLIFLTVLYVAGLLAWLFDLRSKKTPVLLASVVIAGIGAGIFLGAWV